MAPEIPVRHDLDNYAYPVEDAIRNGSGRQKW